MTHRLSSRQVCPTKAVNTTRRESWHGHE